MNITEIASRQEKVWEWKRLLPWVAWRTFARICRENDAIIDSVLGQEERKRRDKMLPRIVYFGLLPSMLVIAFILSKLFKVFARYMGWL